jgi:2-dehydropantoate 2-reductase
MRVLIMGAGGVGGYFGARLARAGEAVTVVARGAHLDALRRDGLRVRSTIEGEYQVAVEAVEDVRGLAPADVILFCVKSFDTETAAAALRPAVAPGTAVISFQNGVDNLDKLEAVLGPGHVVGGAAYVFAAIEAPGVIAHRFAGRLAFGELDGRPSPRTAAFKAALDGAGIPADLSPDIRRVLWEKYLFICAQAGMTALTRCPSGVLREVPETWLMYRRLLEELAAVARASGVDVGPEAVEALVKAATALGPATYSSLYTDLTQGRRLELDALHGHAVRLGERLGVPTPMTFAVYAALKPHAGGRPG